MKYYHQAENRIIETEELVKKYGSEHPIPQLGIFYLSEQPEYNPVSFEKREDGSYYPVESYESMQKKAVSALVAAGYTETEAAGMLA